MLSFFAVAVMQMAVPVTASLLRANGLTAGQVGLLMSAYLLSYGPGQMLSGWLPVRAGGRVVAWGLLLVVVSALPFVLGWPFWLLMVARFVQGVGAGATFPAAGYLMNVYLAPERLGRGWSSYAAGAAMGNLFALLALARVGQAGGVEAAFLAGGGIALLATAAALARPEVRARPPAGSDEEARLGILAAMRFLFAKPEVRLLAVINASVVTLSVVTLTWTAEFLREYHGASVAMAATITAGYAAAQLLGAPASALLLRRMGRLPLLLCMLVGMVLAGAGLALSTSPTGAFIAVFMMGFFMLGSFTPSFALIPEYVPARLAGMASGVLNGIAFVGALAGPWVFGLIVDIGWGYRVGYAVFTLLSTSGVAAVLGLVRSARRQAAVTVQEGRPGQQGRG
jgi:AAHS family 3-hydroxyphenylpropionic acid transporter